MSFVNVSMVFSSSSFVASRFFFCHSASLMLSSVVSMSFLHFSCFSYSSFCCACSSANSASILALTSVKASRLVLIAKAKKGQAMVFFGDAHDARDRRLYHALPAERCSPDQVDLDETKSRFEKRARFVAREDLYRFRNGPEFLIAGGDAHLVLLFGLSTHLLGLREKFFVGTQGLLGAVKISSRVRDPRGAGRDLVLVFLDPRDVDLDLVALLGLELVEGDEGLELRFLRLREVGQHAVQHRFQHAQDLAAPRVVGLRARGRALQVVELRVHALLLLRFLPRQEGLVHTEE